MLTTNSDSHGSLDPGEIYLAGDRINWNGMKLDLQITCSLIKCDVGGRGNDPEGVVRRSLHVRSHTDISGSVIPLVARAQSRCAFIAMMMLSVPPEVIVPAPVGLLNSL